MKKLLIAVCLAIIFVGTACLYSTITRMQAEEWVAEHTKPAHFAFARCLKITSLVGSGIYSTTIYIPPGGWMPFGAELCEVAEEDAK